MIQAIYLASYGHQQPPLKGSREHHPKKVTFAELPGSVHFLVQNWFESILCSIFLSPIKNLNRFCLMNFFLLSKKILRFFWCLCFGRKIQWIFLHFQNPTFAKPGFAAPLVVALPGGSVVKKRPKGWSGPAGLNTWEKTKWIP